MDNNWKFVPRDVVLPTSSCSLLSSFVKLGERTAEMEHHGLNDGGSVGVSVFAAEMEADGFDDGGIFS